MHGQKLKVVCHTVPGNHGFSPSLENVTALPTSGCEAISTESSQATLNITNSLRQQKFRIKKPVAITLETRQSLEDSPSDKPLGAT